MIEDKRKIQKLEDFVRRSNMSDSNKREMLNFLREISVMIGASK